ncbi:hypothetical protein [Brevibacterium luteolum]|uniref:hypothetical protein n=1 Tax=Brevibacterium luteolum TaxID=199591 RepID=UPI00223AEB27|nr:hypothetical protein [Brevibacterium luteolum]MCT1873519.1 hypothetical protein [Brevibacterium luteolum]MCT1889416.1 hypothetical protein [Brevibacterium luteolum]MCT1893744.1 hypothetical protein [Brevibacterium luteolum]MCT1923181.1 hypothetical protein [Brevibacterium luteolum]
MVRLILAAFSAIVGLVCAALSLSALSVVGADDIVDTAPSQVHHGAYAFVLNPQLVPFENTEATLQASGDTDLFMGTASGVDVDSYLTGIAHEEVTEIEFPQALKTRFVDGEPAPLNDAAGRDWWTASQTGSQLSHTFDLDAESGEVIVVAPADPEGNLDGVDVQLKMDTGGVFPASLIGLALAILAFGAAAYFLLRWLDARPGRRRRLRREYGRGGSGRGGSGGSGMSDLGNRAKDLAGRTAASAKRATARKNRSQRTAQRARKATGIGSVVTLGVLAGCSPLPVAQPSSPNLTEFERPALRAGEAGEFLTSYTERLDASLKGDEDQLDKIQAPPLLDRTRAEILIAKAGKTELSAVNFDQIVAGGPSFAEYPMWFIAFGKPAESDETVQAMLVTRESAGEDWQVTQSLFVPQENVPALVAGGTGAVEQSGKEFTELGTTANETLQQYLETGEIPENDQSIEYASDAFTGFRDYVDEMAGNDEAFEDTKVTCDPYDQATVPLASHGLKTETGDVSFGEVRCAIELKVRSGGSIDVGEELEAVMTSDLEGGRLVISTSIPYMLLGSEQTNLIVGSDWFLLEAQTTD